MITVESLKAFGANTEEGLSRCLNNEAFYLKMVNMGIGDERFEKLGPLCAEKNYADAFEVAHALKGVIGSLALTPLYDAIHEITELLRARTETDYGPLCAEIAQKRAKLLAM